MTRDVDGHVSVERAERAYGTATSALDGAHALVTHTCRNPTLKTRRNLSASDLPLPLMAAKGHLLSQCLEPPAPAAARAGHELALRPRNRHLAAMPKVASGTVSVDSRSSALPITRKQAVYASGQYPALCNPHVMHAARDCRNAPRNASFGRFSDRTALYRTSWQLCRARLADQHRVHRRRNPSQLNPSASHT